MTTVTLTIAIPDDIPVKDMVQEIDDALLKDFKHDFTIRTNKNDMVVEEWRGITIRKYRTDEREE